MRCCLGGRWEGRCYKTWYQWGRARAGRLWLDQYSESLCVEEESSGGISTRESWVDSQVSTCRLENRRLERGYPHKAIDKMEPSFSFQVCRGQRLQRGTEGILDLLIAKA